MATAVPAWCSLIKPYLIHLRPPSVTDALISETVSARRDPSLLFFEQRAAQSQSLSLKLLVGEGKEMELGVSQMTFALAVCK